MRTRLLTLVSGIAATTMIVWGLQHTVRLPLSRRAIFPWGALGGAGAVLWMAARSNSLGDHRAFVAAAIAQAILLCLTIRWSVDLVVGPVDDEVPWGSSTAESPVSGTEDPAHAAAAIGDALRPAGMNTRGAVAERPLAELKLVSESDLVDGTDDQPRAARKRPGA